MGLLTNMVKHSCLPWDCILSAELKRHYKPDPEAYLGADLLGLLSKELMMLAAHKLDLRAAQAVGFEAALVARPAKFGHGRAVDTETESEFDVNAADIEDLASKLGC